MEACLGPLLRSGSFEPEDPPRVIDPACGEGVFLVSAAERLASWIARARPGAPGEWVARQALGAVHGVDLDPVALYGARVALVGALGGWGPELEPDHAPLAVQDSAEDPAIEPAASHAGSLGQLLRGNALLGPGEAPASLCPLDLEAAFPGARPGGRFDLVVGNPPFVDSEEMTRSAPALRKALAARYQAARGNWDLFCPFVERAIELAAPEGLIGLILPNKLLSARYAAETRRLLAMQDMMFIWDCSSLRLFEAAVYPVMIGLGKRAPRGTCRVDRAEGDGGRARTVSVGSLSSDDLARLAERGWGELLSPLSRASPRPRGAARLRPLGELCEVRGASTVAEAYSLGPLVRDGEPCPGGFRLVNTGLLDPFRILWGERPLRYLGQSYERPWVDPEELARVMPGRADQARQAKIIVGGLTRRLECAWDGGGSARSEGGETRGLGGLLAGKSTSLVLPREREGEWDGEWALALLGLLNCEAASAAFGHSFSGLALAGGYLRVGPPQLRAFEVPDPGELAAEERRALARLARRLTSLGARRARSVEKERREGKQKGGRGARQREPQARRELAGAGMVESEHEWLKAWQELSGRTWGLFGLAPPAK